jgi:hypothetical protein
MSSYEDLYSISPLRLMAKLDRDISELRDGQRRLDSLVRDMTGSLLEKKVAEMSRGARPVGRWNYDVRFPNYVLSNVYQLENQDGRFKRWVGPRRCLEFSFQLDRSVQYDLVIETVDFRTPDIERQFALFVDSEEIFWLSQHEGTYTANVPEDLRPRAAETTLIAIGPRLNEAEPVEPDASWPVWFSFSSVSLQAR